MLKAVLVDLEKLSKATMVKDEEIEKRREVIQKHRESEEQRRKSETKKEKLSAKEEAEKATMEKRIEYYRSEIKKAEEKFESYRAYCLKQIELAESKTMTTLQTLETAKQLLDDTISIDEDADKILTRLKIEKEQIEENIRVKTAYLHELRERDRRNKQEEAAMMALIERNSQAMERAMSRNNDVAYTQSFYEADAKSTSSEGSVFTPPKRDPEFEAKLERQKQGRIQFKKSEIFSLLTKKEQQQYRELDFDIQDKVHECQTVKQVKQLLKSFKE